MSGPILVINPNANPAVTAGLDAAMAPFRLSGGPEIACVTVPDGPFGIESQADSDAAVAPMLDMIRARPDAAAIIIACYSDPGIDSAREVAKVPVFGMQESGFLTAMSRGDRIGVVAISEGSILRHRKYLRRMGVLERMVAERPLNMSVAETASGDGTFARLRAVSETLVHQDHADVIVLGCAGLSAHRASLEKAIGRPVVDPTQAAVAMALGALLVQSKR
ncbi:aspartate/glutamate racemase family protein [Roseicyclus sp.]|uniref:aspartate/glutamate racemase family protein n=1 Tax=Roseicyclus sp. TaxID=1914329 RepID=UPI003F6A5056